MTTNLHNIQNLTVFNEATFPHAMEIHERSIVYTGETHSFIGFQNGNQSYRIHVDVADGKFMVLEEPFDFKNSDGTKKELWTRNYNTNDLKPPHETLALARACVGVQWQYDSRNTCQHFTALCIAIDFVPHIWKYPIGKEYTKFKSGLEMKVINRMASSYGTLGGLLGIIGLYFLQKHEHCLFKYVVSK